MVRVKEVLPNWSGDTLDNIIDYVTYVLLPAFALYQSGMLGQPWSFIAAGMIVVSSAIYYADMGMKTDDYFFSGFPVVWNMVIFTLFAVQANEWAAFTLIACRSCSPSCRSTSCIRSGQAAAAAQSRHLPALDRAVGLVDPRTFRPPAPVVWASWQPASIST